MEGSGVSFAENVRRELAAINVKKPCCRRMLGAGLLLGAKLLPGKQIALRLKQESTAELAIPLLSSLYGKAPDVRQSGACGHRFWDISFSSPSAAKLLHGVQEEGVLPVTEGKGICDGCGAALLRGAFLAYGTVNDPHKSFHLELLLPEGRGADALEEFLTSLGYPPRRIVRTGGTGLYFKDSGSVEELITLMGGQHVVFEVINSRIERDIRNNENRATNCVAKNIEKAISAGTRQMEAIGRLIEAGRLDNLPEGLRITAMLRYRNPDASLDELTALHEPPISKSGLNHRLQRILAEAEEL